MLFASLSFKALCGQVPRAIHQVEFLILQSIITAVLLGGSIGVGTRGARGAPAPPIYKSGGGGPPQCWSYRRCFNCENVFLSTFQPFLQHFLGSNTNFNFKNFYMCFTHIKKTGMCTHMYIHVYVTEKIRPP